MGKCIKTIPLCYELGIIWVDDKDFYKINNINIYVKKIYETIPYENDVFMNYERGYGTAKFKNKNEYLKFIKNIKYEKQIRNIIENADWKSMYNMVSTPKIKHWMIYKYLKEQIPELK